MVEIADLSHLEPVADRIARVVERPASLWVSGAPGSGRGELSRRVLTRVKQGVVLDLVSLKEPDAALHALLQAAATMGERERRAKAATEDGTLFERARGVAEVLAANGTILLVNVPGSWRLVGEPRDGESREADGGDWQAFQAARARELLQGFLNADGARIVLFTARDFSPSALSWDPKDKYIPLRDVRAKVDVLHNAEFWGDYAEFAEALARELDGNDAFISPFELRLAVGLVALGQALDRVVRALYSGGSLNALGELLEDALRDPKHEDLRRPLFRLALARGAIQRKALVDIASPPARHQPLLTTCIGYGHDEIRVTESVRLTLLEHLGRFAADEVESAHLDFAQHHAQHDGAVAPQDAAGMFAVTNWLEKAHHLAHSGERGREQWEALELKCREFYLDRARALSIEERDYIHAAQMYEKYVGFAPGDAYGWHYLGFNLDRANERLDRAEEGLRKAVDIDKGNPWWNSRLVTFLIRRARFRNASAEWRAALRRVDPDGRRVRENTRLAMHFHRWVVQDWLEYGEVAEARSAFDVIPPIVVRTEYHLRRLGERLEDIEEALKLGDSVYPEYIDIERRWQRPFVLPRAFNGKQLVKWFPGRVVTADATGVTLLVATTDKSRMVVNHLDASEWAAAGWGASPAESNGYFVEVGVYGDHELKIMPLATFRREFST
jgi:tetratricopeptide (TPR) repeat protein